MSHQDILLNQFISGYLKLPIFAVSLEYETTEVTKCIYDPLQSHLDLWKNSDLQRKLLNWAEIERFPFFYRSRMFSEFRFCINLMRKLKKQITYDRFQYFKENIHQSQAYTQLQLWLCIDECSRSDSIEDSEVPNVHKLTSIQKRYQETIKNIGQLLPCLDLEINNVVVCLKWCKDIQEQITERLIYYWWPRTNTLRRNILCNTNAKYNESFLEALQSNVLAGDPFLQYLVRAGEESYVIIYQLWMEINEVLSNRAEYTNYEIEKRYMKIYAKYYAAPLTSFAVSPETIEPEVFYDKLFNLQDEVLEVLKRRWTGFQQCDYESFYSCFNEESRMKVDQNLQNKLRSDSRMSTPTSLPRPRTRSSRRTLPKYDVKLSLTDLFKTPFEGMPDTEVLDEFKHYLAEKCGDDSIQVSSYQLWLSVLLHKKMPPSAREKSAKKIYRKFFSKSAKSHLTFQNNQNGNSLLRAKGHQNISRVFDELELFAMENFSNQLLDFLKTKNGDDHSLSSRSGISSSLDFTKMDGVKDTIVYSIETVKEFQTFLRNASQSGKMRAFEEYLKTSGAEQCPGIMINNLNFWRQVEKFQVLRGGSASKQLLLRKIEALIDNYLDADTPPWVKISISSHTAKEIVDRYEMLAAPNQRQQEEEEEDQTILEMLVKAQKNIFLQLLELWAGFSTAYRSEPPSPSRSSSSRSSTATRKSRRSPCPPPPPVRNCGKKLSVLSFTRQEGLQWMENLPKTCSIPE